MRKFGPGASVARHSPKQVSAKKDDTNVAGIATGAASGGLTGAEIGSAILPGWGTAIGGAIGAIGGGVMGAKSSAEGAMADAASVPDKYDKTKKTYKAARELAAKKAKEEAAKKALKKTANMKKEYKAAVALADKVIR
tara:strand:- start:1112 stop:1525 length:414 start_codon:yes stop_codon:yes gene_type:complete